MSHNAVVKELRNLKNLSTSRRAELEERRRTYAATVKILLLMGASVGTKVSTAPDLPTPSTLFRYVRLTAAAANVPVGPKERTHVFPRGSGGGQRGAAAVPPRLHVVSGSD